MKSRLVSIFILIFSFNCRNAFAWNNVDLEIFDLVEEINRNFYEMLEVKQDASTAEIRRAFRTLSVKMHPDKNDAEDANIVFRNIVAVHEVLKDPEKREIYDNVLRNGLPNWKSALYYYRHVRKMGLAEMSIILFVIITVGQYIIAWAAYAEKKYTAENLLGSKIRRMNKKNKSNVDIDTILNSIPTPSVKNTLPFQIVRFVIYLPRDVKSLFNEYSIYKQQQEEQKRLEAEEEERQRKLEEQFAKEKEERKEGMRKRKPAFQAKEMTADQLKGYSTLKADTLARSGVKAVTSKEPVLTGGLWTDEDLAELVRFVKKYPNGTLSRWEIIAEQMNRSVQEVTFMAAKMKETGYRLPNEQTFTEAVVQEATKKAKKVTEVTKNAGNDSLWSQDQQKMLELAIVKYPKMTSGDRWLKISNSVPGKSREECMARYKFLAEKIRLQKAKEAEVAQVSDEAKDNDTKETNEENVCDDEDREEEAKKKIGGKPRNKRKERKKQMRFSSDEEDSNDG